VLAVGDDELSVGDVVGSEAAEDTLGVTWMSGFPRDTVSRQVWGRHVP